MKFALLFLVALPLVMSARLDDRFIESLLGGYDILDLGKQLVSQFATDETEQQCETQLCPPLINPIDHNNHLITSLVCAAACKEAQILAQHMHTAAPGRK